MFIEYIPTYHYFSNFISIKSSDKILDFGSNTGNFLKSSPLQLDYTGIDVDKEAVVEGNKQFPNSSWIHYNRYNCVYNQDGDNSLPNLKSKFDLIVSYSVFTHIDLADTLEILAFLYESLSDNGRICFSFCNVENKDCIAWFRNKRVNCDEIPDVDLVYLIDNKVAFEYNRHPCNHFVTFYRPSFVLDQLKNFSPTIKYASKPWVQDCIILSK